MFLGQQTILIEAIVFESKLMQIRFVWHAKSSAMHIRWVDGSMGVCVCIGTFWEGMCGGEFSIGKLCNQ